ncbi:ATP-binding cassette domain-containing protein, partial [Streptococcus canis]|uniref:ATP-binding cassette domain-containing protein n=1 Tax=Streptococcus canis TaxID=1329 RepID=UPI002F969AD6
IIKLILRLWDNYQGNVCINNKDIRNIKISSLRNKISYISQDIFLLNGTLRENLQSKKNELDDCLIDILYKVNLGMWFEKLTNGLDTNLGENGAKISGGEKQRIVIARTILQKPQVIIFDEATSMLDEKTEENIISLIKKEFQNCLIIFITHRLRSINSVDSILVLDNGKIVEIGTFKELINNSESLFGKMFMRGANLSGDCN